VIDGKQPGWDRQTFPAPDAPSLWLRWKDSDVEGDFRCPCGHAGFVEGAYLYYVRCPGCDAVYFVNGHVELVPLTPDETAGMDMRPYNIAVHDAE
jgi:hypothetical protein